MLSQLIKGCEPHDPPTMANRECPSTLYALACAKNNLSKANYIIIPVTLFLSFLTYRQAGIWNNSATLWDHAIKVSPSSRAYVNRARMYNDEKNYPMALQYYNEAIKINVIDNEAFTNRGNIYFNAGKMDLAYADYRQALALKPDYFSALDNLGALYATRGQYDSALNCFNKSFTVFGSCV